MATEYILTQVASDVQKAINNALNPSTTLTESGKPADAKAVGDKLDVLENELRGIVVELKGSANSYSATVDGAGADSVALNEALLSGANVIGVAAANMSFTTSSGVEYAVPAGTIFRYQNASVMELVGEGYEFYVQLDGHEFALMDMNGGGTWEGYSRPVQVVLYLKDSGGNPVVYYNGRSRTAEEVIDLLENCYNMGRPVLCWQENMAFLQTDGLTVTPPLGNVFRLTRSSENLFAFRCEQDGVEYVLEVNDSEFIPYVEATPVPVSAELNDENIALFKNSAGVVLFTLDLSNMGTPAEYGVPVLSVDSLNIQEGSSDTFTVRLDSAPTVNQVIYMALSDETKLSISPTFLTFTPDNWSVEQTVTVYTTTETDENVTLSTKKASDIPVSVTVYEAATPFEAVNWLDTAYMVGQNNQHVYNGWCPDTVAYDETRNLIVFQQVHNVGNHSSNMAAKTLCTIDPYDPTVYTDVSAYPGMNSSSEGVGGLVVENGVWTTYSKTQRRRSSDGGATWQTDAVVTPPARMYGVFKVDDVLYCGDDYSTTDTSHNGWYYVSYDDGLNWEQKVFDFADDYEIQCSEARFCQWKGKLYATIRREANTGLLARLDDSGWVVIYDQLPNVTSDSSLLAFDDLLAISSVDRPNKKLILSTWDGTALTVVKEYDFSRITYSGDFHTPTYIHGEDFQAVFFMTFGMYGNEYRSAMNAAVFGYKDGVEANTPTYEVDTNVAYSWKDIVESPSYNCSVTIQDDGVVVTTEDTDVIPWVSINKRWPNCHQPDENGKIVYYAFTNDITLGTFVPDKQYENILADTVDIGGRKYICVTKANRYGGASADIPMKIMGIANKITIENSNMTGAMYTAPANQFDTGDSVRKNSGVTYGVVQN